MKLDNQLMQIIIPAIVGVLSSVTTFLVAKSSNSKDLTVNERQRLSEDEKQFRAELMAIINSYKVDLEASRKEIKELREEVASLHKINLELTSELQKFKKNQEVGG
jgi:uncharacterized protein involved in exopolysaccharide biosynthesis